MLLPHLRRTCASCLRRAAFSRCRRYLGWAPGLPAGSQSSRVPGAEPISSGLRGSGEPPDVFCAIPGVGPVLAKRLHETLHVETLEQLEAALHEKGGQAVAGLGPRRLAILRAALAQMLARIRPVRTGPSDEPPVDVLLDVDREYQAKVKANELRKIAPKRFNPKGEAWLPILHTRRGKWHFTALYSNTARAHELDKVKDWVVLYFHSDSGGEAQRTIVTETRGVLTGHRVVRGREHECLSVYERPAS